MNMACGIRFCILVNDRNDGQHGVRSPVILVGYPQKGLAKVSGVSAIISGYVPGFTLSTLVGSPITHNRVGRAGHGCIKNLPKLTSMCGDNDWL